MTTFYTSNDPSIGFDATTTGALPGDWANKSGTWQVGTTNPVGSHAKTFASSTGVDGDVALVTGISAVADMQVQFTQILPSGVGGSAQPIMSAILRCDSGYSNCYTCVVGAASAGHLSFNLYKRVGGSYSAIGAGTSPQSFATSGAITVNIVAQIAGTTFSIKAWQGGTTMPSSFDWTMTDGSVSAAGFAGLYNALNGASGARSADDFIVSDTSGTPETISVTTPASETAGTSYSYTGSYTGTQPAALDYEFDAAGFTAAPSPTIGGGTFSFTVVAPAAGSHTLTVRDHNSTGISGTSGSFTTGAPETITVTTPATETTGTSNTYAGTYTGGPPTALDFQFDSAGYVAASSPTISGGNFSFTATAPAAGTHTLSVRDHNSIGVLGTSGSFTTSAAETIAVTTPGTETAGNTFTYSGTYTGGPPTALDFQFDSAGYVPASSPTISGGNFSFSATAPAAGTHTLSVRDHNNTGVSGTSGSFTTSATETISVTTPATETAGNTFTYSGTYTAGPPTALDYQFDSAGYVAAPSPTISGGNFSFSATAPASGTHTLSVRDHNNTGVSGTSGSFTTTGAETISVTTPGSEVAGTTNTYSGTYTAGPPTALDFEFDSAGFAAASSPGISGGVFSFSATSPVTGTHTLTVRDHNNTTVVGTSGSFTTTVETITVNTPATETAGVTYTYSGSYAAGTPTALDYQFDSAGFTAASSPVISGGVFSFSATAPAVGSHTLTVRDHNAPAASGTSGSFTTDPAPTIAVTTPSSLIIDGQPLTVSGTYANVAPTGLNYRIDSGSFVAASSPTIGGGTWSFVITAPAFGSHTITVQEANATATTATSGSFTVSSAPNHAAMLYSPYNWNIGAAAAITDNAGAYFRTLFGSSTTCVLNFDVSGMVSPTSEIWTSIDNGPWTQAVVSTALGLTIPAITLSNADVPYHLLQVVVKSTTETQNRWNAGASTRVVFKGLTLDAGATLLAPLAAPKNFLIYGDSITEGVRTLGEVASNDTDRNDAMMGWAFRLGALLGAEVGVVGFGASGLSVTGSGNVPVLGSSYNFLYAGVARSFTPVPDLVVFNEGTNDGSTNIVAAMTAVLNGVLTACPGTVIAVLRPFNGNQAASLQAAIAACSAPASCHYVDTTGFFNTAYGADSSNLHPSGPNNLGRIAPQLATALRPLLAPGGSASIQYRNRFESGLLG